MYESLALDLSMIEIALIATMLAPTDATLGKSVVSNEAVPANIRQSLNLESGLNDGICGRPRARATPSRCSPGSSSARPSSVRQSEISAGEFFSTPY